MFPEATKNVPFQRVLFPELSAKRLILLFPSGVSESLNLNVCPGLVTDSSGYMF